MMGCRAPESGERWRLGWLEETGAGQRERPDGEERPPWRRATPCLQLQEKVDVRGSLKGRQVLVGTSYLGRFAAPIKCGAFVKVARGDVRIQRRPCLAAKVEIPLSIRGWSSCCFAPQFVCVLAVGAHGDATSKRRLMCSRMKAFSKEAENKSADLRLKSGRKPDPSVEPRAARGEALSLCKQERAKKKAGVGRKFSSPDGKVKSCGFSRSLRYRSDGAPTPSAAPFRGFLFMK